ncbi:hypothetical protein [Aeromonas salmonicida]|uniref:hypothetical protein n=1 Tax=Aeromonas salmonicida TaxID=645 RepID=UPI003D1974D4
MTKRLANVADLFSDEPVTESALSPRERKMLGLTKPARAYRTQKEVGQRLQERGIKQSMKFDAYELAVRFGLEQTTITESEFLHEHARVPKKAVEPAKREIDPMWLIK